MSFPFGLAVFGDLTGETLTYEEVNVSDLGRQIEGGVVARKEDQPLGKLARFGSVRTEKNSLRHDLNVIHHTGVESEHDAGTMPFAEAKSRLETASIAYVLYTTASHTGAHPRWRVLCPFSKPCLPGERAQYVDRLNGLLGGVLARESWVISQAFFIGRVAGVPFEIAIGDNEECIDDADELAAGAMPLPARGGADLGQLRGGTKSLL